MPRKVLGHSMRRCFVFSFRHQIILETDSHRRSLVSGMQHAFQERELPTKFPRNTKTLLGGGKVNRANVHTEVTCL